MSDIAETLGQRLKAEREKKGLSAQKAADALHLDGWVIEGLETDDYARIGPAVYAKGHLKRYAELLGLVVPDVLAEFDGHRSVVEAPTPAASMRMRTSAATGVALPWVQIAGCGAVVLVIAGVWWWRPWHPRSPAAPAAAVLAPAAAGGASTGTPAAASGSTGAASGAPPAATTEPAASAGSAPAPAPATEGLAADPTAGSGRARLRLSFLGDSWVDVHDAGGQRLFAGNGHLNNVRSMSGAAPFRVYLKTASNIRMEINNHVVAIAPQYVVGNVAHFEAGADGVLRRDPHAAGAGGIAPPAPAGSRPRG